MNDWSPEISKEQSERLDELLKEQADAENENSPEDAAEMSADDLRAENERLSTQVEVLRQAVDEARDEHLRARAELDNYRRRRDAETANEIQRAREAVLRRFLAVLDDFDRAMAEAPEDAASKGWLEGFQLIERRFWSALEAEGVHPMESVGQPFDPNRHDAVQADSEAPVRDTVVEEYQRGYLVNDDVLRPAMVKVGSAETVAAAQSQASTADAGEEND